MDNKELRSQGARLAALSMAVGCAVLLLIDLLPSIPADERSGYSILGMIFLAVIAGLFSLPFSFMSGYALAWFLQQVQWFPHSKTKVVVSGVIIASISLFVIFIAGGFFGSCLIFHGQCGEDYITLVQGIFRDATFMKALMIAAICGGVTAWQLSQLAQQKTA